MFLKYLDTVSKNAYNKYTDTLSARLENEEGLNYEKSYAGTDHAKTRRNHKCL